MRNHKPCNVVDTFGGAFGLEGREELGREGIGERRHYNERLIGLSCRPHD